MQNRIVNHLENPEMLEKLFRENKNAFSKAFENIAIENDSELVRYWKIRLSYEDVNKRSENTKVGLLWVILLSLVTGILVKLPDLFTRIDKNFFYTRDLAIIVFNGIILFTFWQNRLFNLKNLAVYATILSVTALFINLYPNMQSDSIMLSAIFVPLLLWCLYGLAYTSFDFNDTNKRMNFLRFNGELLITAGLLIIAGGIFSALTIQFFSVIDMHIEDFYFNNIAIFGAVAVPILSIYLLQVYPGLTKKIAPVIAKVFAPIVLVTMTVYLISLLFSNNHILYDRELLLLLNAMLLAILAIIVFSVSELDNSKNKNINVLTLFLLSLLALIINAVALFAILTRVSHGLTPNRTVVLGSNILIFIHLILIGKNLLKTYFLPDQSGEVEKSVTQYINIYALWTVFVIFLLPFLFKFR